MQVVSFAEIGATTAADGGAQQAVCEQRAMINGRRAVLTALQWWRTK